MASPIGTIKGAICQLATWPAGPSQPLLHDLLSVLERQWDE